MIINQANLAMLTKAFSAAYKKGFASFGVGQDWQKIATMVPSSTGENDYAWLGHFPSLREWLGDRHIKDLAQFDYTIKNRKFESTVEIPVDDIEDDQFGVYTPLMESMGHSAGVWPDEILFALALLGASNLCYDGQNFFDTDHPMGDGTASNYDVTGGGNLWMLLDTTRPLKPFVFQQRLSPKLQLMTDPKDEGVFMRDAYRYGIKARGEAGFGFWQMAYGSLNTLNATNFDAAVEAMMALESDEGKKLGIRPNLLVCGPSNRAEGRTLLESERLASGASNTNFKAVDLLVTPYMT